MGWVLDSGGAVWAGVGHFLLARQHGTRSKSALEKALYAFEDFAGLSRRVYDSAKLAAVPHAMSEPASELLHFAYSIGLVGRRNLPVVVHE